MSTSIGIAVVALADPRQELLAKAALLSAGFSTRVLPREPLTLASLLDAGRSAHKHSVYIVDCARLAADGARFSLVSQQIRRMQPNAGIILFDDCSLGFSPLVAQWADKHGAIGRCARLSVRRLAASAQPLLDAATAHVGAGWEQSRLRDYATALLAGPSHVDERLDGAQQSLAALEAEGIDLAALIAEFSHSAVPIEDRRWRMHSYPQCFVGSDAVAWLARKFGVDNQRAISIGQTLLDCGVFYHVAGEQPFRDGNFFYRFHSRSSRLAELDIDAVEDAMHGLTGVEIADRSWRGLSFPRCFVGEPAAQWLMSRFRIGFGEAVTLGQAILQTHAFRHVADEHGYFGSALFYRFFTDRLAVDQ